MKIYNVGGNVRDAIMNIPSKDIDYAVEAPSYEAMKEGLLEKGLKIYLETPEYFTIRGQIITKEGARIDADFVLCRKDGNYSDNRRPDEVYVGTIYDDLARRDFTMNAIAVDEDGTIIDPYYGRSDITNGMIRCVGSVEARMTEDALRMLRALRFSITKNMLIANDIRMFMSDLDNVLLLCNVSTERIREELFKMFSCDTYKTLQLLNSYPYIERYIFTKTDIWLKPTTEVTRVRI